MEENKINIETIHQCNCCLGNKTLHPLVSVIDLEETSLMQRVVTFNFYTVLLREGQFNEFFFGRQHYDYSDASLLFFSPGRTIQMEQQHLLSHKGCLLAFHPDLLYHTSLGTSIGNYTFFAYNPDEALHLSQREKAKAMECLRNICQELQHSIDSHSKTLLTRHIELFLDYCARFYERQFITRNEANREIICQTDKLFGEYIRSGNLCNNVLPSVDYVAGLMGLSSRYFTDLLKFETGKTFSEYFQLKRFEISKKMLLSQQDTVSQIAELLGYPSVQYFSALFRKITGVTPKQYRFIQN